MGALAGDSTWTMEDDFRLRKVAETGVSLESLVKGDVQFLKRFTIQELQDRWLAILFDPVVSAQASACMRELKYSDSAPILKTDNLGRIEEKVSVSSKRKPESIRKLFYAMRKKMRDHQSLDLVNVGFPNENLDSNGFRNEEHPQNEVAGFLTYEAVDNADVNLDVNLSTNGDNSYIEHKDNNISVMENDVQIEESDGFEELYDLLDMPLNERDETQLDFNGDVQLGDAELENQMCGEITTEVINANSYLMELSNNLLDLDIDDDLPLMDADGNVIDKSYIDDWSSVFLDFPNKDVTHDNIVDEFLDNNMNQLQFDHQETKSVKLFLPPSKLFTSTIICTLNTEDTEIPSNDDVFLLNLVPSTSGGMQIDVFKPPPPPTSKFISGANSKRDFKVPKKIIPKDNKVEKSLLSSPIIGSQWRSEILGDHKVKHELSRSEDRSQFCPAIIPKSNIFPLSENSSIKSENKTVGNHDMHTITTIQQEERLHAEIVSTEVINPIPIASHVPINQEPLSSQSYDNDYDDIPNYSDVEAMILDEDSSLDEQHLCLNGIGSSEHLQIPSNTRIETQKRIIRLEQAAVAYVKRDLTSRGAFAVFQGWHIKYYIKKPEVLVGRETEDFNVDIDLGRESRNSKVSRRQAIIHLDHKGSFHLKNLSKYSVFVNRVELATNQSISLTSSCLIEIKGMAFLFETNEACIKQYVNSIKNKTIMENKS